MCKFYLNDNNRIIITSQFSCQIIKSVDKLPLQKHQNIPNLIIYELFMIIFLKRRDMPFDLHWS